MSRRLDADRLPLRPVSVLLLRNEGVEPRHVHVEAGDAYAKLWLDPVAFAASQGFNGKQMNEIRRLVEANRDRCVEAWDDFFRR